MDKTLLKNLVTLSDIFKDGFTVKVHDNKIMQLFQTHGYIISYKTLITISRNKTEVKQLTYNIKNESDLNGYVIGGWFDKDNNTYYIEKNIITYSKDLAIKYAKRFNQKEIFDIANGECIKV